MKKITIALLLLVGATGAWAQSNPTLDRPIQQCITQNKDDLSLLPTNFSMGNWLYKLSELCDRLKDTDGKKGGQYVVALLEKEKELDDLLAIADKCPNLTKVKPEMQEMKKVFAERQKVENFKTTEEKKNPNSNMFEEDKEITTMSLPRGAAGKIKGFAEKIHKKLK